MLIAVPVMGNEGMDAEISGHFGHAPFFAFAEVENGRIESVEFKANPFAENHAQGSVPSFLVKNKVNVLIAGSLGQRAYEILTDNGIKVYPYASGTLKDAIDAYISGKLDSQYKGDILKD
ncbi:MAG: dinitrogenase iron-molybdenum cofactor biosynthesis protein [Mesoaciditoga sp.]|uniref:NifB/NifX family molybdenum-iron cluster-binding protein n=1 Tax=Athalassotoga sp. TaxID=2022597 RepID=UPI000CBB74E8|nr:MAG: dinitrogenase iron-molybdenum cofactor biosynthesis protein [Mesoaciditoga sp.]PMP79769.1 MAG: dinitrogenase iron-molybdenum cofactor biosynthesis protein [Mesoaciditoga sp.]HEU24100.1 dinitrogenase iron-molybdenum cofactor biosynthesis protein [Mesoaciditoga lauensis]